MKLLDIFFFLFSFLLAIGNAYQTFETMSKYDEEAFNSEEDFEYDYDEAVLNLVQDKFSKLPNKFKNVNKKTEKIKMTQIEMQEREKNLKELERNLNQLMETSKKQDAVGKKINPPSAQREIFDMSNQISDIFDKFPFDGSTNTNVQDIHQRDSNHQWQNINIQSGEKGVVSYRKQIDTKPKETTKNFVMSNKKETVIEEKSKNNNQ